MKQSSLMSFVESLLNTLSGFLISLVAQWLLLPVILGVSITLQQNIVFAILMTFVSVARGFAWRRLMERLHIRHPISPFMLAVIAERRRQFEVEGWTPEHDDDHGPGELAQAGACYALADHPIYVWDEDNGERELDVRSLWRWDVDWWKPKERRRNLVRGCALIAAEGERFDRGRKRRRASRPIAPARAEFEDHAA